MLAEPLSVVSFQKSPNGFTLTFNQPLEHGLLRLYDGGAGHPLSTPVLNLTGEAWGGRVTYGSLVLSTDRTQVIYAYTFGMLPDDTWTVTIPSLGYTHQFTTAYGTDCVGLGILAANGVCRGPGQTVDVAANGSTPSEPVWYGGIPVQVSDGNQLSSLTCTLTYNTALLSVTGTTVGSDPPAGETFTRTAHVVSGGIATDTFVFATNGDSLPAGNGPLTLGVIQATIPVPAQWGDAYGQTQLLDFQVVSADGRLPVVGVAGLQVVAYIGNVTNTGTYAETDASLIGRVAGGVDTGFAAFPVVDPVLLADILTEWSVGIGDSALVCQKALGEYVPSIPDIPQRS